MVSTSVEYDEDGNEVARWMWCVGEGNQQWLKKVTDGTYVCPGCGTIKQLKNVQLD